MIDSLQNRRLSRDLMTAYLNRNRREDIVKIALSPE